MSLFLKEMVKKIKSPEILLLFFLALLFYFSAPRTVQFGDTGELVTNSFYLRVSHPPGYPLWTAIYHLPIRLLSFLSPFFVASLFTVVISLLWIGLLVFNFKNKMSIGVILVLTTNLIFWRYSILPDVFALHLLFLTLVFWGLCKPELLSRWWYVFLVSLSVAHHHTILFVFPMYLYALFYNINRKKVLLSLVFGIFSLSLYFLLLFFHPKHLGSWGNILTIKDVVSHFLRKDYGTFALHGMGGNDNSWLLFFVKMFFFSFWSFFIAGFYVIKNFSLEAVSKKLSVLLFCFFIYLFVFFISGVMPMDRLGELTFERFLLQPFLIFSFMILLLVNLSGVKLPQWIFLCFLINSGVNLLHNFKVNNYSANTLIEDYMLNNLQSLPSNSVLYNQGDTYAFATYYLREVHGVRPDIKFFSSFITFPWGSKKIMSSYPEVFSKKGDSLLEKFDFDKFIYFSNVEQSYAVPGLQWTYYGLLFKLEKKSSATKEMRFECNVARNFQWRHRLELQDFQDVEFSYVYDQSYGSCYFSSGFLKMAKGDYSSAARDFEKAVALSPFSAKNQRWLCIAYKKSLSPLVDDCEQRLEMIMLNVSQHYD
jgi:hypothetical protein